jgi:t-SNARE complex subunit (syntaxin)
MSSEQIANTNAQLEELNQDLQDLLEISRTMFDIVHDDQHNLDKIEEKITDADGLVELGTSEVTIASMIKKSSRFKKALIYSGLIVGGAALGTAGFAVSIPVAVAGILVGSIAGTITGTVVNYKINR